MRHDSPVIVALDFPTHEETFELVKKLDPNLCRLKVGITMFTQYGPGFVDELMKMGFDVFLDLKFHDIPHQVAGACRSAAELGVWMLTVHTLGGQQMCEVAANAIAGYSNRPLLVGVTVLTSSDQRDLAVVGIEKSLEASVHDLTKVAQSSGLDGVVCSPLEVAHLRKQTGDDFILVTPGIRLQSVLGDDQRRVTTPEEALAAGSTYLVMGRSITQADDPVAVINGVNNSVINNA